MTQTSVPDGLWQYRSGGPVEPEKPGPSKIKTVPKIILPAALLLSPSAKAVRGGKCSFAVAKHVAKLVALRSTDVLPVPRTGQADFFRS